MRVQLRYDTGFCSLPNAHKLSPFLQDDPYFCCPFGYFVLVLCTWMHPFISDWKCLPQYSLFLSSLRLWSHKMWVLHMITQFCSCTWEAPDRLLLLNCLFSPALWVVGSKCPYLFCLFWNLTEMYYPFPLCIFNL